MKTLMLRLIIGLVAIAASNVAIAATHFNDETLNYKVNYKWGLINKQAGHAKLTLKNVGEDYVVQLTAASEPWADKYYQVRDTLNGIIERDNFRSKFYEKIAHEGNEDKHDTVTFGYDGDIVTGACTRRVVRKGKERVNRKLMLEAEGTTVDMISAYYYMRSIDYNNWKVGDKETITIFSGKRKEALTIEYHGIEDVKADKKTFRCYHITFIFTSDGGKKTSDDMDAWISADQRRIPVRLEGKLPVGKVHCIYTGQ